MKDRYEISANRRRVATAAHATLRYARRHSRFRRRTFTRSSTASNKAAVIAYEGNLWSPGFFHVDLQERQHGHARRLDGKMGHHRRSRRPRGASRRSSNGARVCSKMRFQKRGRSRGGIGFRGGPIHHHASRPRARKQRAHTPPATKCARSLPVIIGSPIGAATR